MKATEKIEDLVKAIDTFTDKKLVESLNSSMEERLAKIEEEIIQKKARKFNRDTMDYETGQIYTFAKKFEYWRRQKGNEATSKVVDIESRKSTDVSESSDTDFGDSAQIKAHTSLQDEFDFLRKDRRTNHRPCKRKANKPSVTLEQVGQDEIGKRRDNLLIEDIPLMRELWALEENKMELLGEDKLVARLESEGIRLDEEGALGLKLKSRTVPAPSGDMIDQFSDTIIKGLKAFRLKAMRKTMKNRSGYFNTLNKL
ncbi:hypothetical protein NDU88_007520 [Pleurodeles waltl]|uniref:Uncharacterized protein n=1 Tax=Pleurodeles waltl TaxID=8319 RepID=A0AAV7QS60_PLEWA|nr:hypothetical protein NDU88_007520 [Pleurodeles waltl]